MTIAGIVFDKDGTLLDFHATWVPVNRTLALAVARGDRHLARRLLLECGQDDDRGTVAAGSLLAAGNSREIAAAWSRIAPHHGQPDLVVTIDRIFRTEAAKSVAPVTGLTETIRALKGRGLSLGIATSDSEAGARATLAPFDVLQNFDFIAGYDSGYGVKPGPGMIDGFCRARNLPASAVLVVGDNRHDLQMGRAASAGLVVGVLSGTGARSDLQPLADVLIGDIRELEGLPGLRAG